MKFGISIIHIPFLIIYFEANILIFSLSRLLSDGKYKNSSLNVGSLSPTSLKKFSKKVYYNKEEFVMKIKLMGKVMFLWAVLCSEKKKKPKTCHRKNEKLKVNEINQILLYMELNENFNMSYFSIKCPRRNNFSTYASI